VCSSDLGLGGPKVPIGDLMWASGCGVDLSMGIKEKI
jgi:hypothetical protein